MARREKKSTTVAKIKDRLRRMYQSKYKALFLNMFEFENLEYRESTYIMNNIYTGTSLAAFRLNTNDEVHLVGFAPYTEMYYYLYGYPIKIRPLNTWNSKLIPNRFLENNKNTVIIVPDLQPAQIVDNYVEQLIDIDMTIRTNLKTHKIPFGVKSERELDIIDQILDDEEYVFLSDDLTLNAVNLNTPYIIDKLMALRSDKESELLTFLGINNVKHTKAAQQNNPEIDSNRQEIGVYKDILLTKLENWFEKINELFGTNYSVKPNEEPITEIQEFQDEEDDLNEDNSNE
jgi:hypothetical protein